jgi:hypothetical protein
MEPITKSENALYEETLVIMHMVVSQAWHTVLATPP